MARPESNVGTTLEHHTEKKHNLKFLAPLASILLIMSLASACAPKAESTSSTTVWRDPGLQTPDRGLTSLVIELDFLHNPAGSVGMETFYNDAGGFRIVSKEVSPKPGYLVDETVKHEDKNYSDWPVSPINTGDVEIVYLAPSSTKDNDYRDYSNARKYLIKRTGNKLEIKYQGLELIPPPGTLPMRDAQALPAK